MQLQEALIPAHVPLDPDNAVVVYLLTSSPLLIEIFESSQPFSNFKYSDYICRSSCNLGSKSE